MTESTLNPPGRLRHTFEQGSEIREYLSDGNESEAESFPELTVDTVIDPHLEETEFFEKYYPLTTMSTSDFDLCWDRRWEHPRVLALHWESVFLESRHRLLSQKKHFYDSCSVRELRNFVHDRRIIDPFPAGVTLRYFYIKALLNADNNARFDLMNLPVEMRFMVYEHLLKFDKITEPTGVAQTAILRTCRAVNEEATRLLYQNTVVCKLETYEDRNNVGGRFTVNRKAKEFQLPHTSFVKIPDGMNDYPEFLRRIPKLEIRMTTTTIREGGDVDLAALWINHMLLNLSSVLMDGHQIESLTLVMETEPITLPAETLMYPLLRLRNIAHVNFIEGISHYNIPDFIKQCLIAKLRSSGPAFNTIRHYKLLDEEIEALDLLKSAFIADYERLQDNFEDIHDFEEEIEEMLDDRQFARALQGFLFSSIAEENFQARLRLVEADLKSIDVAYLKTVAKTRFTASYRRIFVEKRRARQAYNHVSDSKKLAEAHKRWKGKLDDMDEIMAMCIEDWLPDELLDLSDDLYGSEASDESSDP